MSALAELSVEAFHEWCGVMVKAAERAGYTVSRDTVSIHAGAFYMWAQGDITLIRLAGIVNERHGDKMVPCASDPSTEGH
jgi:hypothetical protein